MKRNSAARRAVALSNLQRRIARRRVQFSELAPDPKLEQLEREAETLRRRLHTLDLSDPNAP